MKNLQKETHAPLAYSIPEFMAAVSIGSRSTVYREINAGRLNTVTVGTRRLIPHESAIAWLDTLKDAALT